MYAKTIALVIFILSYCVYPLPSLASDIPTWVIEVIENEPKVYEIITKDTFYIYEMFIGKVYMLGVFRYDPEKNIMHIYELDTMIKATTEKEKAIIWHNPKKITKE